MPSSGRANFAGFDGDPSWFYLGEVVHKAYVDVNEEGTEAAVGDGGRGHVGRHAAATAGVSGGSSVSVPDSGERHGQHPLPGTHGQSDPDGAVMPPFRIVRCSLAGTQSCLTYRGPPGTFTAWLDESLKRLEVSGKELQARHFKLLTLFPFETGNFWTKRYIDHGLFRRYGLGGIGIPMPSFSPCGVGLRRWAGRRSKN